MTINYFVHTIIINKEYLENLMKTEYCHISYTLNVGVYYKKVIFN